MATLPVAYLPRSRQRKLYDELTYALRMTPSKALTQWAADSAALLGHVTWRRIRRLPRLVGEIWRWSARESKAAIESARERRLMEHAQSRFEAARQSIMTTGDELQAGLRAYAAVLRTSPYEEAPRLAVTVLAALAASGGVDGDGGIPDLDLEFGIGAHRSILTHSILSGAVLETLLGATATLTGLVYHRLPLEHDPLWDAVNRHKDEYLAAAARGGSIGIAYHLFVDAAFQPGAYHDLPGEHALATHRAIQGANAALEGVDGLSNRPKPALSK